MQPLAEEHEYISAPELAARTGKSVATIWRLKKARKIPFYQPGGDDHFVLFPANAIETTAGQPSIAAELTLPETEVANVASVRVLPQRHHLSGSPPAWMRAPNT